MSYPSIFQFASASPGVTALLGTNPTRFWPFGQAPQNEDRPYAVHQLAYGSPENTLSCSAGNDLIGIQIDVYARTASDARQVAEALRIAIEPHGYIVSLLGEQWEPDTGLYRNGFTAEFWQDR